MKILFWNALRLFILLSLLTGVVYPLALTGVLPLLFPAQTQGSLVHRDGTTVGSSLLAQKFTDPHYFWARPSAVDYATVASGASNLGPTSLTLKNTVAERATKLRVSHGVVSSNPLPADLLFASASGLDPHISPDAAYFQLERVARARAFTPEQTLRCHALIQRLLETPQWGVFGETRVNVLLLNLELDTLQ
jgi:K+-transporting ATPase ATPase C chain